MGIQSFFKAEKKRFPLQAIHTASVINRFTRSSHSKTHWWCICLQLPRTLLLVTANHQMTAACTIPFLCILEITHQKFTFWNPCFLSHLWKFQKICIWYCLPQSNWAKNDETQNILRIFSTLIQMELLKTQNINKSEGRDRSQLM